MACTIGIDVGGTKTAGGLVELPGGMVLARRVLPTDAARGGEAVLGNVVALVRELQADASRQGASPAAIGLGLAELVGPSGDILSDATIRWMDIDVAGELESQTSLRATIEADVRAAARGEAELGAGRGLRSFLYVTVGTGISACLVANGTPYTGVRGLAGSFASARLAIGDDEGRIVTGPATEQFAAGPALASRLAAKLPTFQGAAPAVLELAESGNAAAKAVVDSAGCALGAAIAQLVNILDPEAIVLGGGLGLAQGRYRDLLEEALRAHIYADGHRDLALLEASLGVDAGWIGAALCAAPGAKPV